MFVKLLVLTTICLANLSITESVVLDRNQLSAWFPYIGTTPSPVKCQSRSIKVIESGAFNNLGKYPPKLIYLHNNQITNIRDYAFANATSISGLWLNNNHLSSLNELTFFGLTELVELYLNSNALTYIDVYSFTRLTKLQILHLYNNKLTSFQPYTFSGLLSLVDLDLSTNYLTSIDRLIVIGLVNLVNFWVGSNPVIGLQTSLIQQLCANNPKCTVIF